MAEARFAVFEVCLFAAAKRKRDAERILSRAHQLLAVGIQAGPVVRAVGPESVFRVDGEIPISVTGAYRTLGEILETLRPLAGLWEIVIPGPSLCGTMWHLSGITQQTRVEGLVQIFFQAYNDKADIKGSA